MQTFQDDQKHPDDIRERDIQCVWLSSGDTLVGGVLGNAVDVGDVSVDSFALVSGTTDTVRVRLSGGTDGTRQKVRLDITSLSGVKEVVFLEFTVCA